MPQLSWIRMVIFTTTQDKEGPYVACGIDWCLGCLVGCWRSVCFVLSASVDSSSDHIWYRSCMRLVELIQV